MSVYLILLIIFIILFFAGLWAIFEKSNYKGWMSIVPLYNFYIWLKIIKKPLWWFIFILTPFINIFMILLIVVETLNCFGKRGLGAQTLAVLFPFFYLPWLGFFSNVKYQDPDKQKPVQKSVAREWLEAIIFAVIAATVIRTFFIEAYTIPSSSMEKTLLIGDFLFVSKVTYGPRVPMTPLSFPFAHHTLPLTQNTKSYLEWISLPYYRFPGIRSIKNNDVVVFNYPDGDTLSTKFQSNASYYALIKEYGRERVWHDKNNFGDIIARPVDKRENFVKRCVAIPGDTLEIIDRVVYINGKPAPNPGILQFKYHVTTNGTRINPKIIEKLDITDEIYTFNLGEYIMTLTENSVKELKKLPNVLEVTPIIDRKGEADPRIFPFDIANFKWNVDNYGPLWIPKAGTTIPINMSNISLYQRIIDVYEDNDLKIKGDKIFINGKESNTYTFKMDYYWLMGDNRHNSADSRYWGFVPIDHVVGNAVFVWLSLDKNKNLFNGKIRWNKTFRVVH